MEGLTVGGAPVAHGACVGVGCVASLALFEWLSRCDLSRIDVAALANRQPDWATVESEVRAAFADSSVAANALEEMRAKHAPGRVVTRLTRLKEQWGSLSGRLRNSLPTPGQMATRLARLRAAAAPEDIGLSRDRLARDYLRARLIRRRYTVFDVLADLGCFEIAVNELFADGYWAHPGYGKAAATR
jgi:glycerol-1-phosphate dehydrogenase [NAD(P)+]